jgi:hypothetical protein
MVIAVSHVNLKGTVYLSSPQVCIECPHVTGTVLEPQDTASNKTRASPCFQVAYITVGADRQEISTNVNGIFVVT